MRSLLPLLLLSLMTLACSSYQYPPETLPGKLERIAKESGGPVSVAYENLRTGAPRPGKRGRVAEESGGLFSVAYENLGTGARLSFQDSEILHAASTMKVPVMMAIFEAVDRKQPRLHGPVRGGDGRRTG